MATNRSTSKKNDKGGKTNAAGRRVKNYDFSNVPL
jgi:hypothetical protein